MKKRVKLEYTGLIIVFLIIGGIFFFMNDLDLEITGNAFLNISTYSSSNLSSFPTGTLSNVSVFGDGSVKLSFNPTRVGSLTDAPGGDNGWLNAARKIFVLGNFAHVTAQINDSISLIDITNKSFPTINGSNYSLWLDGAVGVFALGNYTYVVSNNNDSFNIINTTNKSAPVINSSLIDIGAETNGWTNGAWGVFVSGDYAFITARQNDSMSIINITNKSAPVINGSFNSSWLDGAEEIFVSGDYAYIASNLNDSITVINITNYTQSGVPESNPVKISHLTSGWLEGAAGIHISGDFAYVTADINDSISIIDISNKSNITLLGSLTSGWLDGAEGIYVSGDYAYVTSFNNDSISIIDISNKSNPTLVGSLMDGGGATNGWLNGIIDVEISGDYAYTVSFANSSINIIKINETYSSGTYESEVINATYLAKWINLSISKTLPTNTSLTIAYRSCDNELCSGETYSAYTNDTTMGLSITNNQYFQFKVNFTTTNLSLSPKLNSVDVFFSDDVTAPSATFTCTPFNNRVTGIVTCVCSGTDGVTGLGIASISSTIEVEATARGEFTVSGCTVTDIAGNSASATGRYDVLWSGGGVILPVPGPGEPTLVKTHVIVKIIPGEETTLSGFGGTGVKEITIEVNNETNLNIKIKVSKYDSEPNEVSVNYSLKTYRYLAIDTQNLNDILEKATVKFEMDKTWLTTNNLDKDDITLLKFNNQTSKWDELKTDFDSEDDNFYYYTTELDSFSFFAIAEKSKGSIISGIIDTVSNGVNGSYDKASETKQGLLVWWGILGFLVLGIIVLSIFIVMEVRMRRKVRGIDLGHLNTQFPPEPAYGKAPPPSY